VNFLATAAVLGVLAAPGLRAIGASDIAGRVLLSGLPVPGATVMAARPGPAQGGVDRKLATVTNEDGVFGFANLEDGTWTLHVEMRGFVAQDLDVTVPMAEPRSVTLSMRSYEEIMVSLGPPKPAGSPDSPAKAAVVSAPPPNAPDIINGSVVNGAASRFGQPRAFGNNRPKPPSPYSFGLTGNLGSSAWNARPYSFGGSTASLPSYGDVQVGLNVAGPFRIPWLLTYGPQMTLSYSRGVSHNASMRSALMPTPAERAGDFSQSSILVRDPLTGLPFDGNVIPAGRIAAQAAALVAYYPLPNTTTTNGANYQTSVESASTQDSLQFGVNKTFGTRTTLGGAFGLQRSVSNSLSLFNFADANRQSSVSASMNVTRRLSTRLQMRVSYQFTRAASSNRPFFAHLTNVSGDAGITGNDQDPANWGPPTLSFPDIADLSDAAYQRSTRMSHAGGAEFQLRRGRHNMTLGGDLRWNGTDVSSQPDPRGTLSFTGAATGRGFADFLLGLPTTSSIAFGNASARLRGGSSDAYFTDDFRVLAGLTMNAGVRWEYESPFTEVAGHLVNLDVAPGFAATSPVLATDPAGSLTGRTYPVSLLRPDRRGVEPRVAVSWRPILTSSLVIKASYGLYRNLGTYQPIALMFAQAPPFSTTISAQNTPQAPLTLASPFPSSLPSTTTLAVDPDYRAGYLHSWSLSAQRDLPASLTLIVTYFHDRGTHLMQAFLPNTYPAGAENPCVTCPSGFVYLTSNGRSDRNAAQFVVRRRLHSGFTATLQYTLAKSNDDAATFSNTSVRPSSLAVAQDWLHLGAEYGPSSFDQRHVVSVQAQYTSGVGIAGGTLVEGFWGRLFKDWTITSQLTVGSGLPVTPLSFVAIAGTGFVGVRPSLTGVSVAPVEAGSYANPDAFVAPAPGAWGDAGRNSIRGPRQFSLNMTVARTFRLPRRMTLEWRVAATNVLNRVTFSAINATVGSPQFGRPIAANSMRRIQASFVFRF
jgi:hypothetical protein